MVNRVGRILCIDYGTRRLGLAQSDETKTIATGLETITYKHQTELFEKLKKIVKDHAIEKIVLGRPTKLNGTTGKCAREVEAFAARVRTTVNLPVEFYDERLSTVIAHRTLHAQGKRPSRAKPLVDKVSAIVILEGYLERNRCAT